MIENKNFILEEIPDLHPIIQRYERREFWSTQKRRCIEGYWVGGKWIPGPLYYYVNFHHIEIENQYGQMEIGLPWLRDIDWELFLLYEECRGFSGFEKDTKNTCNRKYGPERELAITLGDITKKDLEGKTYIPARDYLRSIHQEDLGKPLYENPAKNFISIQSRGGGKSFGSSGIADHNFLFDGAIDYDYYVKAKKNKKPLKSETIIGAIDTKYTMPIIKKVKLGLNELPGKYVIEEGKNELIAFSPLAAPGCFGSFAPNRDYYSKHGSSIKHRTYKDNPNAGSGGRPNVVILDEIGYMTNVREAWQSLTGGEASKMKTNMVIWALGTGGLVGGRAALFAESIFRNPQDYNCITFEDQFENRGTIGYFVPYTKTLNKFKEGPNLVTNNEKALTYIEHRRTKAKNSPDSTKYYGEIINGPLIPSEAFLVVEGSYFPTLLLKEQLAELEGGELSKITEASFKGKLVFEDNELKFITVQDARPIREFPLEKNTNKEGYIELWIKPQRNEDGIIPHNLYIGGMDVVDKDKSTTDSLPSILIMNRLTRQIVAEYTGRTEDRKDFYETCRRLLLYYNATGMYEQNLPGLFTYFEQYKSLYLLADTPYQLRNAETFKQGANTSKGINATGKVNSEARSFIKSWLLEKPSPNSDERNLNKIYSPALLKELIMWNPDGNFDRVSALGMLLWHDETQYKETDKKKEEVKSFLDSDYFEQMGVKKKLSKFADIQQSNYIYDE